MSSSSTFESLRDLHDSVNNLLHSPDMKHVLYQHKHDQEWVQKVSESSLKMLDSCGTVKDILCLVKGHIQDLQSTFRRATLGKSEKKELSAYCFQRKKMRKQMLKRLDSLKKVNTCTEDTPNIDDNLILVVGNMLKEVRKTVVILLESIMLLMSMPNPSLETSLNKKKMMMNCNRVFAAKVKFTRVNSLSQWEDCDVEALQSAIERLEAVESAMEDLEVELGCIFKRLMRTRVLLLNILTN